MAWAAGALLVRRRPRAVPPAGAAPIGLAAALVLFDAWVALTLPQAWRDEMPRALALLFFDGASILVVGAATKAARWVRARVPG